VGVAVTDGDTEPVTLGVTEPVGVAVTDGVTLSGVSVACGAAGVPP
jgi:hypothetical protein